MRYKNILRWTCGQDDDQTVRNALELGEKIGRYRNLENIPGGVSFTTFFRPDDSFFGELYAEFPEVAFNHEYASANLRYYEDLVFMGDCLIESYTPDAPEKKEQCARELWGKDIPKEERISFADKVEGCWQEYLNEMMGFSRQGLIDKAGDVAAVKYCRDMLTSPELRREDSEYLMRFENPLEVVSDAWLDAQNANMSEEFDHVLWVLRDRQTAEQDYIIEPGYKTGEPEQSM